VSARSLITASYAVLGAALLATRLVGLGRSYWHDEIVTVADFVRPGPREILSGHYIPNNHELFSILGWATSSLVGESEIALRLWSVLPFLAGVALVTAWLHVRVTPLSGVLFLFLATVSPLLLDLSRQARGYGLAFFAMSVLVVAALETGRTGRTWAIVAVGAAGVVGTCTLPIFGVAFVAIGAVLITDRVLRMRAAITLGASLVVIAAWYAPHVDDLLRSSRQEYGVDIELRWIVTAPVDQILIPALVWIDGVVLFPGLVWIPLVAVAMVLMASSPLLHERAPALVLAAGPVATILALWVTHTRSVPRFLSFLLVPVFILAATGSASILERIRTRPALVRTVLVLTALGVLSASFVVEAARVIRMPREAHKEAVEAIRANGWGAAPVYTYVIHPRDLAFYLGRKPVSGFQPRFVSVVCSRRRPIVLVEQPWVVPPVTFPCLRRPGVRHYRFEQYTRGDEINVWFVPPPG
jgi:hypothetical protein